MYGGGGFYPPMQGGYPGAGYPGGYPQAAPYGPYPGEILGPQPGGM